jgi:hypothetical protein
MKGRVQPLSHFLIISIVLFTNGYFTPVWNHGFMTNLMPNQKLDPMSHVLVEA